MLEDFWNKALVVLHFFKKLCLYLLRRSSCIFLGVGCANQEPALVKIGREKVIEPLFLDKLVEAYLLPESAVCVRVRVDVREIPTSLYYVVAVHVLELFLPVNYRNGILEISLQE